MFCFHVMFVCLKTATFLHTLTLYWTPDLKGLNSDSKMKKIENVVSFFQTLLSRVLQGFSIENNMF